MKRKFGLLKMFASLYKTEMTPMKICEYILNDKFRISEKNGTV